ncbi:MAG: hypothetical protein U0R51_14760, partial [Solirubrobacterales bacterium]
AELTADDAAGTRSGAGEGVGRRPDPTLGAESELAGGCEVLEGGQSREILFAACDERTMSRRSRESRRGKVDR